MIWKHLYFIQETIETNKPSVIIMTDSQIKIDDEDAKKSFKDFNIENKFMTNMDKSRVTVLIRNNVQYSRLTQCEDKDIK